MLFSPILYNEISITKYLNLLIQSPHFLPHIHYIYMSFGMSKLKVLPSTFTQSYNSRQKMQLQTTRIWHSCIFKQLILFDMVYLTRFCSQIAQSYTFLTNENQTRFHFQFSFYTFARFFLLFIFILNLNVTNVERSTS